MDLSDPEARLQVAQLLREVAKRSFVGGEDAGTPAGTYVDDLLHGFARAKMRELMGLQQEGSLEPPLTEQELSEVRHLLEADRLDGEELAQVRAAMPVVTRIGPLLSELQQQIATLAEVPRGSKPVAPTPPLRPREDGRPPPVPNPGPRGRITPAIPMPRGHSLTLATAQDAGRASLIAQRTPANSQGQSQADGEYPTG